MKNISLIILLAIYSFANSVEIYSRLANNNLFANEMQLHLRIYNKTNTKLDLSKVNLTYKFSENSALNNLSYDIWWFSNGNATDAKISFYENSSNSADKSFKLYFVNGVIESNNYAEVQLRVHKADWSFFNMVDDYSVPQSGIEWAINPNISFDSSSTDSPIIPDPTPNDKNLNLSYSDMLLSLNDYLVFGANEIKLADRVSVNSGRTEIYGTVGTNNYAEIGADSYIYGNLHSDRNAFLRERAHIFGSIRTGENYTTQNFVQIDGEKLTNNPLPNFEIPQEKDLIAGTTDIIVKNNETLHLEPGTYRDLTAYTNSKLYLKTGKYTFRNFRLEPESKLNLDLDHGNIEVYAVETVTFSDRVLVFNENSIVNPLAFKVYQHGSSDLRIGTDLSMGGYFMAPNATIRVSSRVRFAGWLHGKNIFIEPDTKVCEPPTLTGLTHSKIAYSPYFNALNSEYYTAHDMNDLEVFAKAKTQNTTVDISKTGNQFKIKLFNSETAAIHPWCAQTEYTLTVGNSNNPIVYVKENSECSENSCNGTSWSKAFKSLQKGLVEAKKQGKSVWLAEGNYNVPSDSVLRIEMGTEIRGAFKGENLETLETRSGGVDNTVIKGNTTGKNSLLFFGGSTLPYSAYLDMATITNTNISSVYASPILDYLVIKNNNIDSSGGGVYSVNSDGLKISNSYIVNNGANLGGALYIKNGNFVLENSIISANRANNGTAIYAEGAKLKIRHVTIADNVKQGIKGIAFIGGVSTETANNIIWNNGSSDLGTTTENPLFKHNIAAGEDNSFFSSDDGYALDDNSPLIDKGIRQEDIPIDIFQIDRKISKNGNEMPDMGAREWFYDLARDFNFLKNTVKGLQPVEKPTILKENSSKYLPLKLFNTPYAYVLSAKIPKNKYMKDKHSGTVRLLSKDEQACGEKKNVTFYRIAEENGLVEYRTYRNEDEGIYLFLAQKEMPSYEWYHVLKACDGGFHVEIVANK